MLGDALNAKHACHGPVPRPPQRERVQHAFRHHHGRTRLQRLPVQNALVRAGQILMLHLRLVVQTAPIQAHPAQVWMAQRHHQAAPKRLFSMLV